MSIVKTMSNRFGNYYGMLPLWFTRQTNCVLAHIM